MVGLKTTRFGEKNDQFGTLLLDYYLIFLFSEEMETMRILEKSHSDKIMVGITSKEIMALGSETANGRREEFNFTCFQCMSLILLNQTCNKDSVPLADQTFILFDYIALVLIFSCCCH